MKKLVDKGVKKKKSAGDAIADFLIYLVCLLFIILCIYPFYYIMIYSISDPNQAATGMVLLPKGFSLETFRGIFRLNDIPSAFVVSVLAGRR